MRVEIPDALYEHYQRFVKERLCSDDVPAEIQKLIELELQKSCVAGFDTDALTNTKTRYQLEQDVNESTWGDGWQDHSIFKGNYLCIDIDNFKRYLDVYGLTAGDNILSEIGKQLREHFSDASVYRFGGDEFVVQLGEEGFSPLNLPSEITVKHSVVKVSAQRNQRRNHYINRMILFHLDKGIVEARPEGKEIICEIQTA